LHNTGKLDGNGTWIKWKQAFVTENFLDLEKTKCKIIPNEWKLKGKKYFRKKSSSWIFVVAFILVFV
jgi:hypothetical protein